MDELEFRRRLLSNPATLDEDMIRLLSTDPDKKKLHHELLSLDQQLKTTLSVAVPPDLADRLLLEQSLLQHKQIRQRRWWLGMAASLLLVSGLMFRPEHWTLWPGDMASHALAHVYHELPQLQDSTAQVDLPTVNLLLASLGGKLSQWPDAIRFARFCDFQGTRSLHLIFNTEQGPVTVFVLPKHHGLSQQGDFSDEQFHGHNLQLAQADLVLVAARGQPLTGIADRLQQQLQFQI